MRIGAGSMLIAIALCSDDYHQLLFAFGLIFILTRFEELIEKGTK